ncbi:MAG: hypothetical protein ACD_76C00042G0006 [uncultured bacterium]|nr:MAG: hypothetical protein ACD_76C00042G0006 [uncultured bacterium]HBD05460.1 DNA polymerase III subunit alpha [Candidatus Uhrbacteria bacterium]
MASKFAHLHVHSHYSLLQAIPKIDELVCACKDLGMDAMALTDNGVLYGAIEFYQKAKDHGIKPIIGIDAYLARQNRREQDPKGAKPWRIVLLAKNNEGYANLLKISTIGFTEGLFDFPRIDKEVLRELSGGLIALSGGLESDIGYCISSRDHERANELADEYLDIFGKENFYLELIDRPEVPDQSSLNAMMIEFAKERGIELVATKDAYYLHSDDQEACKIMACIRKGLVLEEFEQMHPNEYDASLVSQEEMEKAFSSLPMAIENTKKISDLCNVELELGKWNFPLIEIPEGKTHMQVLTELANAGMREKYPKVDPSLQERLDYELSVIEKKGFAPYFLVVSDYLRWAESNGIVTTTRGSVAGSLVAYSIGISHIDPVLYKIPFERFLNPERPSAPDVDGDFADNRRDEVLAYVSQKYGQGKMAQICTFGTMLARGSVRDVGRALGYPYGFCDRVAKMIPFGSQGFPMTIERALKESNELDAFYKRDAQAARLIDLARRIEGCARHVSIHAAGVVIAPTELTDYTPLQVETRENKIITQYEMKSVEAAGLLKMDFLGIRNLSILGDAVALVKKIKGIEIDIRKIPVDDKKTFDLLAVGHTMGVFQLSGDGMTKYLKDLKPTDVRDIMAMVALYRPGPIESIPEYIRRKHNPDLVSYAEPRLKTILDQSYGVMVYQDDVLLTAIHLAGYSWLEVDKLRKAMGKKIPEEMAAQKEKLIKGFIEHGLNKEKANELWELIEPFAAYGFNKAHAASYGMVAYQTAYMKANYPAEYMASFMTAESADLEKIAAAVAECERIGISVLPPDINESFGTFTYIDDRTIRFGLQAVKNLGTDVIASMIKEREERGGYKDLTDFATRVTHKAFNKKSIEALIKAGALDRFAERKQLLENIEQLLQFNRRVHDDKITSQTSLFGSTPSFSDAQIKLPKTQPASSAEILKWEKEILGLYVSSHPYADADKHLKKFVTPCRDFASLSDNAPARTAGLIKTVKIISTKKGDLMAFVQIEDLTGAMEVIVFPKTFAEYRDSVVEGAVALVSGRVSKRDQEETKLIANSLFIIENDGMGQLVEMLESGEPKAGMSFQPASGAEEEQKKPAIIIRLAVHLENSKADDLRKMFSENVGGHRVCFLVKSGAKDNIVETEYTVSPTPELVKALKDAFGDGNVEVL